MSPMMEPPDLLKSGPFLLNVETMQLSKLGAEVEITGKPLRILELLMAAPGRVVTRSELKKDLWPNTARIDTERRLNTAVRALRVALGDAADTPRFVATIRGRGYRWIGEEHAPVKTVDWQRPAAAFACLFLLVLGPLSDAVTDAGVAPQQSEKFLRIAAIAENEPAIAAADLDALIENRPDYRAAYILRAELALRAWREAPTAARLAAAKTALAAARAKLGGNPDLDVLAADLALYADWDWAAAEHFYRRAVARDPKHADARRGLAWLYLNSGKEDAVWAELDVLMSEVNLTDDLRGDLGWLLLRMGRDDLALAMCGSDNEKHLNILSCRHTALARKGSMGDARDVAVKLLKAVAAEPVLIAEIREASADVGYQRFLAWRVENFVPDRLLWFQRAQLQAEAGSFGAALASLEEAYARREPSMIKLRSTPEFASLNSSPRYQDLLSKIYKSAG